MGVELIGDAFEEGAEHGETGGDDGDVGFDGGPDGCFDVIPWESDWVSWGFERGLTGSGGHTGDVDLCELD